MGFLLNKVVIGILGIGAIIVIVDFSSGLIQTPANEERAQEKGKRACRA
jgi:hypothetical protein